MPVYGVAFVPCCCTVYAISHFWYRAPLLHQVLVAFGRDDNLNYVTTTEIYDPAANTWTVSGPVAVPRYSHDAVKLADGRVLAAGGQCPLPT